MFIHGILGFISQGPFHNYPVPVAFQNSRDLFLMCNSLKRQMTKPALTVPKESLTLQGTEWDGNCRVKVSLQEVAAHQQCVLCGITAPLIFGRGGKKNNICREISQNILKITRNNSRKVFLLGGGAEGREAGLEMAGAVTGRRGEPL